MDTWMDGAGGDASAGPARDLSRLPEPPGPRGGVPFSRMLAFRRDPLGTLQRLHDRWGDVVHWRFGPRPMYLFSDPELIQSVLVGNHRNFVKSLALQRARMLLGWGLLTNEGASHMRQRRLAQPAFHRDRVAAAAGVMAAYTERAGERWRAGLEIDGVREMNRATLAIAGKVLFDAEVEGEADEIGRALTDALGLFWRLTNPLGVVLDRLPVPGTLRMRRARARLDETIYRIIADRRRSGEEHGDLLQMLMEAHDDEGDGSGMTDRQLRDEAITLFLAGHETTANALAWTWHLLALHPEAEARLHAEVDAVVGSRLPTAEDVPRLEFTRRVLAESMRMYPPVWSFGREPLEEFEAGGYRIRAGHGTVVLLSPWVMHRDPRFFHDPERFDPDRWAPEREARLPRYAYFPFGGGPRKCIGEAFAWMEGAIVLATLSRRWRLRHAPGARVEPEALITLRPKGLRMIVEAR